MIAALMHDCGHGGVNTAFLVNTGDPLVVRYGATKLSNGRDMLVCG